jgi:hypothetical protein
MSPVQPTLLDTCAVVNLFATRRMAEIIASVQSPVAIVDIVERETQFVRRGGDGEDAKEREPVILTPLIAGGGLSVISTDDEEELLTFVDLTQHLDSGEAMTAALAIHRRCVVVTDDRKAIRILTTNSVPIRSTLDVIKTWVDGQQIDLAAQRAVLLDLRQRGTYLPARSHPLRAWWDAVMTDR